jgi:Tfp pilus assembly protein PilO
MNGEVITILRSRRVLLPVATGLVLLFIWLIALFNPEGHKLASLNAAVQSAQNQQNALQARLNRLKLYSKDSSQFEALRQRLSTAMPPSTGVYDYITAISNAASTTGVKVSNVNPSQVTTEGNLDVIPITVSATGTYSQTLAFIKALDALPRLTVISQISITGGGNGTNRATVLTDQFNLDIFATRNATSSAAGTG